ncbi:MAG: sigma-70 family RNA polymerase sigma factor [Myxococcales bacterium]|nr:sigma-70 family RNA polymerase sigma factor [Myxococcales bacterium]
MREEDNVALVARCLEKDEAAWSTLVDRYEGLIYSTALRAGLDEDAAVEVFQQVLVELYRSLAHIRRPNALAKWLMVATRRIACREASRRSVHLEAPLHQLVDPNALPDSEVEEMERLVRLRAAMSQLSGKCAQLLELLFFRSGRPGYEDISRRTGLAVGSIGPIRSRCLDRLRKLMEATA